ncbi:MAG: 4Fe-4S dicluster domain-containing protein, partial [Candidatus Heimdallarchaeota archaeon]|nr:4Fe-4S dicluster domain-containing protein [Candidatus Heimdallarchaeota archaeon]
MSNIEPKKRDFEMLNNEVIEPGYCVSCGGCEAVCPVYVISIEQLKPKLVGDCISCGACIDICLRFKQKVEQPTYPVDDIGPILEIYTGKTNNEEIHSRSQNGGIVTILLLTAMKKGKIDSSLVTTHGSDLLSPVPMLALSEFDIRKSSRSKYTLNPVLIKLSSIKLSNKKKVAIVGLPCHNETLANIMDMKNLGADFRVKYKIGLF